MNEYFILAELVLKKLVFMINHEFMQECFFPMTFAAA